MLYAIVLRLEAEADALVPATHGHFAHGLLLHLVELVDAPLGAALHQIGDSKPFTVSGLHVSTRRGPHGLLFRAGEPAQVRFTFLEETLFTRVVDALVGDHRPERLRLGSASFRLLEVSTQPLASLWAGCATFDALARTAAAAPSGEAELALEFASPTAFRHDGRRNVLFPQPELVFGSLLRRWNTHAPEPLRLDPAVLAGVETHAAVAWHQELETRALDYGRYRQVGFTGRCGYTCLPGAPAGLARTLAALADFAFYAGVGYKTTMGMGQTRRLPSAAPAARPSRR